MKELLFILKKARDLAAINRKAALATVVKIGGSTYRRPGARMLITEEGERWGTISGGCLEGEVAQQAMHVIASGRPKLIPFNLEEDDIVLGFGTGCNGIVHVLIHPLLEGTDTSVVDALYHCVQQRTTGILATIIAAADEAPLLLGKHLLLLASGEIGPSTVPNALAESMLAPAREFLSNELTHGQTYLWHTATIASIHGNYEVLFEVVRPPIKLFIFGEGHDVHALVSQASLMGWDITIVGRKPMDVLSSKFPNATEWKFLMHPDQVISLIEPDQRCAAMVMNHTYVRDRDVMRQLLDAAFPYIGMLGPKERTEEMLAYFAEKGEDLASEGNKRLYGPVGLDIGTETPEEIALSVIAEIQAVLHNRAGASLRSRNGPIHSARQPTDSV